MKISCFWHGIYLFRNAITLGFSMVRVGCALANVRMPMVTVFGSSRVDPNSELYKKVFNFTGELAKHKISVLTGGGPGIMDAANCGAYQERDHHDSMLNTLGIGVNGVDQSFNSKCANVISVDTFFLRKWMLVRYSLAIVVFPGGLGTLDELFDVLNYMKHKRIPPIPLILYDVKYWQPIFDWLKNSSLAEGYIDPEYLDFFELTDDLQEASMRIIDLCERYRTHTQG